VAESSTLLALGAFGVALAGFIRGEIRSNRAEARAVAAEARADRAEKREEERLERERRSEMPGLTIESFASEGRMNSSNQYSWRACATPALVTLGPCGLNSRSRTLRPSRTCLR